MTSFSMFSNIFAALLTLPLSFSFSEPALRQFPPWPDWRSYTVFHRRYTPAETYEDSQLERVGVFFTATAGETREIRVLPSIRSKELEISSPQPKPDFYLSSDGRLQRLRPASVKPDFPGQLTFCPNSIVIQYEGVEPNFAQSLTLMDLASYARITEKNLQIQGRPLVAWMEPPKKPQNVRYAVGQKFQFPPNLWFQPYQFDVLPGISLLPEGVLTPTPIARILEKAEIELGKNIDVTSAIRSPARQRLIYKELAKFQPVALPGRSFHDPARGGIAIDVDNWQEAKPLLIRSGFYHGEPGVGALPDDPWHFVYLGGGG
ncbi:hypothetical protein GC174_15080 [bacterium]|nr:hypothetical protein [bacterium]